MDMRADQLPDDASNASQAHTTHGNRQQWLRVVAHRTRPGQRGVAMAAGKSGRPSLPREVIVGAVAAYLRGDLLKHIAERFNVSTTTVVNHAAAAGFKLRKKRRRP